MKLAVILHPLVLFHYVYAHNLFLSPCSPVVYCDYYGDFCSSEVMNIHPQMYCLSPLLLLGLCNQAVILKV